MSDINYTEKTIEGLDAITPHKRIDFSDGAYILKTKIIRKISSDIEHQTFPLSTNFNFFKENFDVINTYEIILDNGVKKIFKTDKTIINFDEEYYFFIDSDNIIIDFSDSAWDLKTYIKTENYLKEENHKNGYISLFFCLLCSLFLSAPSLSDNPRDTIPAILFIVGIIFGALTLFMLTYKKDTSSKENIDYINNQLENISNL